ncbi:MAG: class I SAM-dependent RNA methyltransferase [Microbacteriaceae bacterium]|nr:class I SAM-dependent RNA methyltransferase [Microbacteriaceae bacterium]
MSNPVSSGGSSRPISAVAVGSVIELDIAQPAHQGVSIAHYSGRVVFVTGAIEGERVLAEITEAKSKFLKATTLEVWKASENRQEHPWPEASVDRKPSERVGAADFGHMQIDYQRLVKQRVLQDALYRHAKIARTVEVRSVPGGDLNWRLKERVIAGADGRFGVRAGSSHAVVKVESLPLAVPEVAEAFENLGKAHPGTEMTIVRAGDGSTVVIESNSRDQVPIISYQVGDRTFEVSALGFWQSHHAAAALLSAQVVELLGDARKDPQAPNHDLYGGVGLFAVALADSLGADARITTVESNKQATEFASKNLAEFPNADARTARVEKYLQSLVKSGGNWEGATVVLDPPRTGAGKDVVAALHALGPENIVYIACDPVALARDLGLFAEAGWEATEIRAFDLFPNTHHFECVALLSKCVTL